MKGSEKDQIRSKHLNSCCWFPLFCTTLDCHWSPSLSNGWDRLIIQSCQHVMANTLWDYKVNVFKFPAWTTLEVMATLIHCSVGLVMGYICVSLFTNPHFFYLYFIFDLLHSAGFYCVWLIISYIIATIIKDIILIDTVNMHWTTMLSILIAPPPPLLVGGNLNKTKKSNPAISLSNRENLWPPAPVPSPRPPTGLKPRAKRGILHEAA